MVEDANPRHLVNMYAWVTVAGLLAVFFAPFSGLLVARFTLIPTVRALYLLAFIMMSTKFIVLYVYSTETRQGVLRMEQTRDRSVFSMLAEYKGVFLQMLHTRRTMLLLSVMILVNIGSIITASFFSLYITQQIGLPDQYVAFFPMVRAAVMLVFLFTVHSRIERLPYRPPMLAGLALYIASHIFLLLCGRFGLGFLALYLLCEAFGFALLVPQKDAMLVTFVDPQERARITALIYVIMLAVSSPFGYIAGLLSTVSRMLPFVLNIVLYIVCAVLLLLSKQTEEKPGDAAQAQGG